MQETTKRVLNFSVLIEFELVLISSVQFSSVM